MPYVVHCLDADGTAGIRADARAAHSVRLRAPGPVRALCYGPLVDADGETAVGSFFLVDAPSRASVEDFFAGDPFRTRGVWREVQVHQLVVSANAPVQLPPSEIEPPVRSLP